MESQQNFWKSVFNNGLLAGAIGLYSILVGLVQTFNKRAVIGQISLGYITLLLSWGVVIYVVLSGHRKNASKCEIVASGEAMGALSAFLAALLPLTGQWIDYHFVFVHAGHAMYSLLTFGQGPWIGSAMLIGVGALWGILIALVVLLPAFWRRSVVKAFLITITVGLLSDLFSGMTIGWMFQPFLGVEGLNLLGTVLVFGLSVGYDYWQAHKPAPKEPTDKAAAVAKGPAGLTKAQLRRMVVGALALVIVAGLPFLVGSYLSHVFNMVGLYTIMGLGLNIVVGYAGLLDLGYVAFFALGAYTMGLLTSTGPLGIAHWTFWEAVPFSILVAMTAGILLGVPVLRMRGDYLAIVTLGFGEIIRILALSNWLKPFIGGAQGILLIPKPPLFGFKIQTPIHFYYLILVGIGLAAFVAYRLRESRLGRAWMAMREDEDVAEAMGIDLVVTKLTAFAFGASFSGLAGAIFASYVGSIFPHSFNLLISINVLSLIIVGGVGSMPGVFVGSLALVGLPELLREFAEYRLLIYGLSLIAMMLLKPEGFWPEPIRRRELREEIGD